MRIHASFPGGNIRVLGISGDTVRLAPDLRGTQIDWFYWSFCVEGAQGRTLTFDFAPKAWVGYFGAAVRREGEDWTWTDTAGPDRTGFAYAFGPSEDRVFFCHDLHYAPERFEALARRLPVMAFPFARSRAGREVPAVVCGEGEDWLILSSRHHCCESTGTYVMEGMLEEFAARPIPGLRLLAVPFMDLDGVV
ncbi:MAG TPA: M14-type cytosolic carboxypeptidase, partial [Clostridia bacterium]|nr:M14-type cytosolic carboxypeptidase [Clostridia bacterium]